MKGRDGVVDNGAMGSMDILSTGFEDRHPFRFVDWNMAFFEAAETDVPSLGIGFVVSEEMGERGKGLVDKFDVLAFVGVKVGESSRERVVTVGDPNTIMKVNKKSREHMKPKVARSVRIIVTGLKTLVDKGTESVESTEGVSTFLSIREVNSLWGVGGRDGVKGVGFNQGSGEGPHYDQWGRIRREVSGHGVLPLDALRPTGSWLWCSRAAAGVATQYPSTIDQRKKGIGLLYMCILSYSKLPLSLVRILPRRWWLPKKEGGCPELTGPLREQEPKHGTWPEQRRRERECEGPDQQPVVIIVGGGQSGLELAARLKYLGVKTLVVEREARIGDRWRKRYEALCLHDPVCMSTEAFFCGCS